MATRSRSAESAWLAASAVAESISARVSRCGDLRGPARPHGATRPAAARRRPSSRRGLGPVLLGGVGGLAGRLLGSGGDLVGAGAGVGEDLLGATLGLGGSEALVALRVAGDAVGDLLRLHHDGVGLGERPPADLGRLGQLLLGATLQVEHLAHLLRGRVRAGRAGLPCFGHWIPHWEQLCGAWAKEAPEVGGA